MVRIAAPLLVALLVASWMLWARAEPSRQGGYCTNVTWAIADLLRVEGPGAGEVPTDAPADVVELVQEAGGFFGQLIARVDELDTRRLQVDTPAEVASDVIVLDAASHARDVGQAPVDPTIEAAAFARVLQDYRTRCFNG